MFSSNIIIIISNQYTGILYFETGAQILKGLKLQDIAILCNLCDNWSLWGVQQLQCNLQSLNIYISYVYIVNICITYVFYKEWENTDKNTGKIPK